MEKAAICSFKAQTGHPPCCDPVEFVIPGLDNVHFVAWGTAEGLVDVGYFEIDPQGNQADLKVLLSLQVGRCSEASFEFRAKGGGKLPDSAVLCLKYGGGPHVLLCAATKSDIAVFRLDCMVQELLSSWSWLDCNNNDRLLVCRASLSEEDGTVLGMSWTNQLDGILVSDSRSQVRMWRVSTEEYGKSIEVCWEAEASEPQDILSAGVSVSSPSASACSHGDCVATVWWPEVVDSQLVYGKKARSEKLKHSCHLKHVDWSPGVLTKDIMGHPEEAHASDEEVQSGRQYRDNEEGTNPDDHPAIMTLDEEGGIRIWVEMLVVHQGPEDEKPTLDSYFAMTLHIEPGKNSASRLAFQNMIPGLGRADNKDRVQFCIWARPMDCILGQISQVKSTKAPVLWLVAGSQVGSGSRVHSEKSKLLRLRLYAVRGLSAVVVSSMHGRLSGASTLSTGSKRPQAILWGEHLWEIDNAFEFSDSQSAEGLLSVMAARVSRSDDFPTITCFAAVCKRSEHLSTHVCLHGCGTTLVTSFKDQHTPKSPASVHQRLEMNHVWGGKAFINTIDILKVAVVNNLALSVDFFGNLSLWHFEKARNGIILMDSMTNRKRGTYSHCVIQMVTVNRECEEVQPISIQNHCIYAIVVVSLDSLLQVVAICEEQYDKGTGSFKLMVLDSIDIPGGNRVYDVLVHSHEQSDTRVVATFSLVVVYQFTTICVNRCVLEYNEDKAETRISLRYEQMPCCKLQQPSPGKIISICKGRKGDLVAALSKDDLYSLYYIWDISHGSGLVLEDFKVPLPHREDCFPSNLHLMDYDSKRDILALAGKGSIHILDLNHSRKVKGNVVIRNYEEQVIRLQENSISSMRWLLAEVVPVLAVGFDDGSMHMYSYRHTSSTWHLVSALKTQVPVPIQISCGDMLILAFGNSVGVVGRKLSVVHESASLGRYLIGISGPLPQYHPKYLQALLVSGNIKGFESIMKHYVSWMREMGASLEHAQREDSLDTSGFLSPKSNHSSGGHLSVEQPLGIKPLFPRVPIHVMAMTEAMELRQKVESFIAKAKSSGKPDALRKKMSFNHSFESDVAAKAAVASQDTGMLDMSAFGMADIPQEETNPQPSSQDTGMLDMSAFGMVDIPQGETNPQPSSQDTGMLDMSAFGMADIPQGNIRSSVAAASDVLSLQLDQQAASMQRNSKEIQMNVPEKVQTSDHESLMELICAALDLTCAFVGINDNIQLSSISETYLLSPIPGLSLDESAILIKALNGVKLLHGVQVSSLDMPALLFLIIVSFQAPLMYSCASSSASSQSSMSKKLGPSNSMKNAAGVEYTLAPSLAGESSNGSLNSPPVSLAKDVGLGQGVTLSSVIWLLLSSTTEEMMKIGAEVLSCLETVDNASHRPNETNDLKFISKFDHGKGQIDWIFLRSIGIAFWLKDKLALRMVIENLARVEFKKTKDPDNVALFYAILGKFEILRGLYRTVNRQKEADFLARDFKLDKNKEAACKNAFVLLGQHRYNLAATFFLLGGQPEDAIEVCATKIQDFQLTLLLCRLLNSESPQDKISDCFTHLMPTSEKSTSWRLLKSWLADDCMGCVKSCIQTLDDSGTDSNEWIMEFLSHYFELVVPCNLDMTDIESDVILSDCQTVCRTLSHEMTRRGFHAMGVQFALISSHCNTAGYNAPKLPDDAIDACAASLIDHPVQFLPDNALDEVFHFNIEKYISELHGLENMGASFSVNKMLHQIEWYYKALSLSSIEMVGTPKDISHGVLSKMASMDASGYANSTASSIQVNSFDDNPILTHFRSRAKLVTDDSESRSLQIIYPKSVEIFRVDGDSLHAVCSCPLLAPDVNGRLLAVSSHKNGVLEFATHRDIGYSQEGSFHIGDNREGCQEEEPTESPAARSGMFTRLVSQIFDQASWVTDPLEDTAHYMIDGDVGVAVSSSMSFSAGQFESKQSQARRSVDAKATHSRLLTSHPSRQVFLSDCNDSGRILLWQFDGPRFLNLFTPMPYSDLRQIQSNSDVFSFSTKISRSNTLTSRMSNWGGAVDISFSDNGERFAAIGDGGVVAVWRLSGGASRLSDVDGAFCSEWWNQCIGKQGRATSFVGGSSVVIVAAGSDSKGNISLWDTVSPRSESCIGYLNHHRHPVNCLQTLPGGWLLASADDKGALSVSDVRMIGSSSNKARTLWNVRASKGKICAIKTLPLDGIQMQPKKLALSAGHGMGTGLVTSGEDGIVRIWDASNGKLVQESDPVYEKTPRAHSLLHLRSGENKYSVTDLSVCDEGIIACGTDGIVRLYPKLE